jgi:hypothetical protein
MKRTNKIISGLFGLLLSAACIPVIPAYVVDNNGTEKYGAYLAYSVAAPGETEIVEALVQTRTGKTTGKDVAGKTKDVHVNLDKTGAVIRKAEETLAADTDIRKRRERFNEDTSGQAPRHLRWIGNL